MNMSLTTHSSLRMFVAGAFAVATAACASAPPPPAAAVAPPSQAFQQASSSPGAAEAQGSDDGVVFVSQDRKDPSTHQDSAPATSLHADPQTARPAPKN
jgi:hypothetical protein